MSEQPELDLENETRAMQSGRGGMLAVAIGCAIAAIAAFGWYLSQDATDPYDELGKKVSGLKGRHFDGFWACALQGTLPSKITKADDMRDQLERRGKRGRGRYAKLLREDCVPKLRPLAESLRKVPGPQDSLVLVLGMARATDRLSAAVDTYVGYLQSLEGGYDEGAAQGPVEETTRGWYDFRIKHRDLKRLLKKRLDR